MVFLKRKNKKALDCEEGSMKNFLAIGLLMMQLGSLSVQADSMYDKIVQTKLDNGLTILVCPRNDIATVSIQLWYNVGSKHEKDGEHGIAHFIEHMIFKGTKTISETDLPLAQVPFSTKQAS